MKATLAKLGAQEDGFKAEPRRIMKAHIAVAVIFLLVAMASGYYWIGLPVLVIVGGSGTVGLLLGLRTYRFGAIDPAVILPPFPLTVAALETHMIEEWSAGFSPAMSRLFSISWTGNDASNRPAILLICRSIILDRHSNRRRQPNKREAVKTNG